MYIRGYLVKKRRSTRLIIHIYCWKDSEYVKARPPSPEQTIKWFEGGSSITKKVIKYPTKTRGTKGAHPRETCCGCPPRIEIRLNNLSKWVIVKYITEHNHPLPTTPSKSRMHRSHATTCQTDVVRQLVQSLNSEGIRPSNIARVCNAAGGWLEQEEDNSFYFAMDLGDDGTLRNVFWADGRARVAYLQFFDVLVFWRHL